MNNPSSVSTLQVGGETLRSTFCGGSFSGEYNQGDEESPDEDEQGSPLGHSGHPGIHQDVYTGIGPTFLIVPYGYQPAEQKGKTLFLSGSKPN